MDNQLLKSNRVTLYYDDSSQDEPVVNEILNKFIEKGLSVLETFFFGEKLGIPQGKASEIELSLTICGDEEIQKLNREYREKDKVTDVLSFPVHDSLRPGEVDEMFVEEILNIGDVIICKSVAEKQAIEFKITYEQEVVHLMVHGILHLCGFDHEIDEEEEKLMFALEEELVEKIYKEMGL